MVCKLGTVVEGDRPSPFGGKLTQHLGHSGGDGAGCLARRSERYEDAGVAFMHCQHCMPIGPEQHQIRLPVAGGLPVVSSLGTFCNGTALSHERSRAAPFATPPTTLRLGSG